MRSRVCEVIRGYRERRGGHPLGISTYITFVIHALGKQLLVGLALSIADFLMIQVDYIGGFFMYIGKDFGGYQY